MLEDKIKDIAIKNGASSTAITGILKSEYSVELETLLNNSPSDLNYLKVNIDKRLDIHKWYPDTKSVLLCSFQYWNSSMDYQGSLLKIKDYPLFFKNNSRKFPRLCRVPTPGGTRLCRAKDIPVKISRYALSRDYHKVIKKKLKTILKELKSVDNKIEGRFFVDTSPVFEKKLSERAGLGWQGKNSLIINREQGSYFFIGGIALSVELKSDKPAINLCADCDLCIKACPTGALKTPGILDANKCISYWTTQSKSEIPLSIKEKLSGNIYGCDICQEVCPYNKKITIDINKDFLAGN
ncbi:MAG: tRNA epoxyqueuosine(34) reductase QueG [Elusimicrobia bacterium]|nr:tRNA epoxyqueuosine(34) reductase QueG [Elusimicrobiota bacterium]